MATRTIANGGGNWTTNGTWVEGVAPTAADNVVATGTSGNITINSGAVCRSCILTGYTGTATHSGGVTLNIGDGTAGTGNAALTLPAGMTWTNQGGTIAFISTSATQQSINTGGQTVGAMTFNGVGGSWNFAANVTCNNITLTNGTLNMNGKTVTAASFSSNNQNTRTLTLGAATLNLAGSWTIDGTNLTFSGASATIAATTSATMNGTGLTYGTFSAGSTCTITNSNTFGTLSVTLAGVSRTATFTAGTTQTISTALTLQGNGAGNLLNLVSSSPGTPWTIAIPATRTLDYLSVTDSTNTGTAADMTNGHSTNGGGNTGWTFATGIAGISRMMGIGY